ncbi:hypothetical protein EUGRSUZ_D02552 [Eucalyptus grandis]|uniref:Uncharacterized protein n=1 Tax=Eucalyptus grandis TaxID=71139 RepID=A0A059CJN4_EUCGR|nr:hypothetical protein EUGRSUZ_D02552 [Eucalyptus grandis]
MRDCETNFNRHMICLLSTASLFHKRKKKKKKQETSTGAQILSVTQQPVLSESKARLATLKQLNWFILLLIETTIR